MGHGINNFTLRKLAAGRGFDSLPVLKGEALETVGKCLGRARPFA